MTIGLGRDWAPECSNRKGDVAARRPGSYGRWFASAAFVHQLAVSAQAFVVVTIRSGERVLDPITALWKDGLVAPASRLSHARRQHPPRPDRIARRRPRLVPERH
jgi:hypothetical protein